MTRRTGQKKPKKNKRLWWWIPAAAVLIFVLWTALDQHVLFQRYHAKMAEAKEQTAVLDAEIEELREDWERRGSVGFVMKYAQKYGWQPTKLTPLPVPESGNAPTAATETTEAVTEEAP